MYLSNIIIFNNRTNNKMSHVKHPTHLHPWISIVTPTYRREKQVSVLSELIHAQTLSLAKVEWIIIDDSRWTEFQCPMDTPCAWSIARCRDFQVCAKLFDTRLVRLTSRMVVGWKRNLGVRIARGTIVVHMDDDDYYSPGYLKYVFEKFRCNPRAEVMGATEIFLCSSQSEWLFRNGPFCNTHSCGAFLSYRRSYGLKNKFNETRPWGEEPMFLESVRKQPLAWSHGGVRAANRMLQIPRAFERIVVMTHDACTVTKTARILHACSQIPNNYHHRDHLYVLRMVETAECGMKAVSNRHAFVDTYMRLYLLLLMIAQMKHRQDHEHTPFPRLLYTQRLTRFYQRMDCTLHKAYDHLSLQSPHQSRPHRPQHAIVR